MPIIDLSHKIEEGMPVYPGTPEVRITRFSTIKKEGYAEKELHLATHIGTHLDAPAHIIEGGKTLDLFPVASFSGKACIIPFSFEDIEEQDITEYLSEFEDQIRDCEFVLLHTKWSEKWGSPDYYTHFPALDKKAAEYLAGFRLSGIGTDTISIDVYDSKNFEAHHTILASDMLIIENLCHLEQIRDPQFRFLALPLFIKDSDGSPARAIAEY